MSAQQFGQRERNESGEHARRDVFGGSSQIGVRLLLLISAFVLAACSSKPVDSGIPGMAEREPVREIPGYFTSPRGGPVKDKQGRCWRTADWRPALAIEECDPALARERKLRELALKLSGVAPPVPLPAAPVEAKFEGAQSVEPPAAPVAQAPAATGETVAPAVEGVAAVAPPPAGSSASTETAAVAATGVAVAGAVTGSAPATAATIAKPPVKPEYVTKPVVLNTDAAFFFGKDRLTVAGKDAVENLAAYIKLWGIEDVQVEVVGHTDRIGSAKDNLVLSQRRAEAVKQVLVETGVPASSITASGVGSSQPVTQPDTCPDDIDRCERINCLAPDRRVEVGLKGTRKSPVR